MKVALLVNSLSLGGAERSVLSLAQGLIREGMEVEVVCLESRVFYTIPASLSVIFLSRLKGMENPVIKFFNLIILAVKLKRYCQNNNVDVVCSHLYRANFVNSISRIIGAKHKVFVVNHGVFSRYQSEGFLGRVNLWLVRRLYPRSDAIVCISKAMKEDMLKILKTDKNCVVINNLYEIDRIKKESYENVFDDEFFFDRSKKYFISIGRLIGLKRSQDLIYAFSDLSIGNKDIELIFLGDGEDKYRLIELCRDLKIQEKVHFLGSVKNPFKFLRRSFLFISASETEGFPNVLIEALACSCPVIFSDCLSGPREILAPSSDPVKLLERGMEIADYGILVSVGDIASYSDAIKFLMSDPIAYEYFKSVGATRAKDFSEEVIAKEYVQLFYN